MPLRRHLLPPALLAALLLAAATATQAVILEASLEGLPAAPLAPEVDTAQFQVRVVLDCTELAVRTAPNEQMPLETAFTAPPELAFAGVMGHSLGPEACEGPTGTVEKSLDYWLSISRSAPGLRDLPFEVEVRVPAQGPNILFPASEASANGTVQADYYSQLQFRAVDRQVLQVSPRQAVAVRMGIENFGNTPTEVKVRVVEGLDAALVEPVPPVVLGTPTLPDEEPSAATVYLNFTAPSGLNRQILIIVEATHHAAADPEKTGEPRTLNLVLRVRAGAEAPAPGVLALLVPLMFAAAAVGRRR